jgi:peptidylprolyl isomerase
MMQKALATVIAMAAAAVMLAAQTPAAVVSQEAPADVSAPPPDAAKTASGLASRTITPGTSQEKAEPTDVVTVHYTAWTPDGKMFDSSRSRGAPSMFPLNRSLVGWRECLQLMTVGETRRCWLPQNLAYQGQAGRPKGMVVFDIELLDTRRAPGVAPPDVAAPPADAKRTASGLAYKVLKPGTGARTPASWDRVTVHYTGWTTDGKMFDSSVARGKPATLSLDDVIRGWTEGMQLMVEGERTRFWIPQNLAYKGEPGSPRGMLVFEIDLIKIE